MSVYNILAISPAFIYCETEAPLLKHFPTRETLTWSLPREKHSAALLTIRECSVLTRYVAPTAVTQDPVERRNKLMALMIQHVFIMRTHATESIAISWESSDTRSQEATRIDRKGRMAREAMIMPLFRYPEYGIESYLI